MKSPNRAKDILVAGAFVCAFAFTAVGHAATYKVLYSFQNNGKDGYYPSAALTNVSGTLYGTTGYGGTGNCLNGCGTIFSINPATGEESVLYSLHAHKAYPGGLLAVAGTLYGTAPDGGRRGGGSIFSFDLASQAVKARYYFCKLENCMDGEFPTSGLIDSKGMLYGTTYEGGTGTCQNTTSYGCGAVFSLNPKTRVERALYSFCSETGCLDGEFPNGGLLDWEGLLYGTTSSGGDTICVSCGLLFAINPATGVEVMVYAFCRRDGCKDGSFPGAGVLEFKRALYGTTSMGGTGGSCHSSPGCGTVYSYDPEGRREKVIHSFQANGLDGVEPAGGLVKLNGILYGTTPFGGTGGDGTVFSVDPATGRERVLYTFCNESGCTDGATPGPNLLNVNETLYGVTTNGGTGTCTNGSLSGCGTVFELTP